MGTSCCQHDTCSASPQTGRYRTILWIALLVNGAMFAAEIVFGLKAGSVSLLADSLDFFGDAANYALSLWVLTKSVEVRAKASLIKALTMAAFGVGVLASALFNALNHVQPEAATMGLMGLIALAANIGVALLLYAYRSGDSNMRSVWLCSRNDAIGNIAVMLAAAGVFGTGQAWPDLLVAAAMAGLAFTASAQIIRHAGKELAGAPTAEANRGGAGA